MRKKDCEPWLEKRTMVLCHDLKGLISFIAELWGFKVEEVEHNIGFDGGKGSLKLIWNLNLDPEKEASAGAKFSGANKSIILGAVPLIPETYFNDEIFFRKLDLNQISYQLCTDLKLVNQILGIGSHSSKYPCPYGHCYRNTWGIWMKGINRTIATLIKDFNDWKASRTNRDKLKEYHNVEFSPLINTENKGTAVIAIVPPPPLHTIKLGPVNHLWVLLRKLCPLQVLEFEGMMHLYLEDYHGGCYEGNQCSKILRNADKLKEMLPEKFKEFAVCLKTLHEVDVAVSGRILKDNYKEAIEAFSKSWMVLFHKFGLSVTNKVHIIMAYVEEYCSATGRSLGRTSDQCIESIHQAVNARFEKSNYIVKDIRNPAFATKFFGAITHFNSYNITTTI